MRSTPTACTSANTTAASPRRAPCLATPRSPTKPNARRASPALLRDSADLGIPRVAIGGITPDNARPLVEAGADLIAVISGIFDAPDPVATARAYLSTFQNDGNA